MKRVLPAKKVSVKSARSVIKVPHLQNPCTRTLNSFFCEKSLQRQLESKAVELNVKAKLVSKGRAFRWKCDLTEVARNPSRTLSTLEIMSQ